jgi:hypothetical protein
MFVCYECCVLSGRGLCDGLITRPEESYRLWRVVVCDQETSRMMRLKPATGLWKYNQSVVTSGKQTNKQTCFACVKWAHHKVHCTGRTAQDAAYRSQSLSLFTCNIHDSYMCSQSRPAFRNPNICCCL